MAEKIIALVPIGKIDASLLKYISEYIRTNFKLNTRNLDCRDITGHDFEPVYGGKYSSNRILKQLGRFRPNNMYKLLAITERDLYSPIFSCLFGEAQLGGCCALISLFRLRQEYYGLAPDINIFLTRCEKEVIHEIAHLFGLVHCADKNCIMYPSNNIIDTDVKSTSFCSNCLRLLESVFE
jgi:archaemetzincin